MKEHFMVGDTAGVEKPFEFLFKGFVKGFWLRIFNKRGIKS